jgi:hypothetical protein
MEFTSFPLHKSNRIILRERKRREREGEEGGGLSGIERYSPMIPLKSSDIRKRERSADHIRRKMREDEKKGKKRGKWKGKKYHIQSLHFPTFEVTESWHQQTKEKRRRRKKKTKKKKTKKRRRKRRRRKRKEG